MNRRSVIAVACATVVAVAVLHRSVADECPHQEAGTYANCQAPGFNLCTAPQCDEKQTFVYSYPSECLTGASTYKKCTERIVVIPCYNIVKCVLNEAGTQCLDGATETKDGPVNLAEAKVCANYQVP
jgi:hypothetical protein